MEPNGLTPGKPIKDEVAHFVETGELFPVTEYGSEPEPTSKPECNGICVTPADLGLPEYSGPGVVAYAHPDCPEHGYPLPEDPNESVCGGDESLRYVREEDVEEVEG